MMEFSDTFETALRFLLATIILGFIPGYSLIYFIIPRGLDKLERFFLSAITSISISSLSSFFLARTHLGLRPFYLIVIILGLTFAFSVGYLLRSGRGKVLLIYLRDFSVQDVKQFFLGRRIYFLRYYGLFILVIAGVLVFSGLVQQERPLPMDEFYILPDQLLAERVLYQGGGDSIQVSLGIRNLASQDSSYQILGRVSGDARLIIVDVHGEDNTIHIAAGESWEGSIVVPFGEFGEPDYIDLELKNWLHSGPVGNLRIWISQEN
jgi:uncharacterized membrane protein